MAVMEIADLQGGTCTWFNQICAQAITFMDTLDTMTIASRETRQRLEKSSPYLVFWRHIKGLCESICSTQLPHLWMRLREVRHGRCQSINGAECAQERRDG
jgi:hypothetical protein